MKKIFLVTVLSCLVIANSIAKTVIFYLYIPDNSVITSYTDVGGVNIPTFSDGSINTIFNHYTVTKFYKPFPDSRYSSLKMIYLVECDSIKLATDLCSYNNSIFPRYEIQDSSITCGFIPNDRGVEWNDFYLDFINADSAWGISKGSPNIVIGVADTYFDTYHPDLQGKLANVGTNTLPADPNEYYHGTAVAGLIADSTNNGKGYAAIGFNCKLDVSSNYRMEELRAMAITRKRRIVNASWFYRTTDTLNLIDSAFAGRGICNEIYDNGTILVAAAGNGRTKAEHSSHSYTFPASYDHVLSVTNVGWVNDPPTRFNQKYIHEFNVGDTESIHSKLHPLDAGDSVICYQHNLRVDICAPSLQLGANFFETSRTHRYFDWTTGNPWSGGAWGTSFGSPIVAGTAGLILGIKPWLSPYQVEYILKKTAVNMYAYTANAKYAGTNQYNGRIGAGSLDAWAALRYTQRDSTNDDPAMATFNIKGIDVNILCRPNLYPGNPKPKLTVVLDSNGKAPYKYVWEAIPGNNTKLSSKTSAAPTIDSSWGSDIAWYRLTVYDNSEIQKVANKEFKIQLRHDSVAILGMRDAYADLFNEPNTMEQDDKRNWNFWLSPDLWNRRQLDPTDSTTHQDPEYYKSNPNYLYTRIKNIGCATNYVSPQQGPADTFPTLKLYWTIDGTDEKWPAEWDGTHNWGVYGNPSGSSIGSVIIGGIAPGHDTTVISPWYPPKPSDYDTVATDLPVCVLARLETTKMPPYGMFTLETDSLKQNLVLNRKIITRNLVVTNLDTSNILGGGGGSLTPLVLGSATNNTQTVSVEVITDKHINPHYAGHLSSYLTVKWYLGDLYTAWVSGGKQGTYELSDDVEKSITCSLDKPIRLDNITMLGGTRYSTRVSIQLKEGLPLPFPIVDQQFFIRQLTPKVDTIDNGDGTYSTESGYNVTGAVCYSINITGSGSGSSKLANNVTNIETKADFRLYPNPATDRIEIVRLADDQQSMLVTITDINGRVVYSKPEVNFNNKFNISVRNFIPGTYIVTLQDKKGKKQSLKFVKD